MRAERRTKGWLWLWTSLAATSSSTTEASHRLTLAGLAHSTKVPCTAISLQSDCIKLETLKMVFVLVWVKTSVLKQLSISVHHASARETPASSLGTGLSAPVAALLCKRQHQMRSIALGLTELANKQWQPQRCCAFMSSIHLRDLRRLARQL